MFKALVVEKDEESGKTSASVEEISEDRLPEGDVTVAVEYSTVNYKDGLCIGPGGGLVRHYPHVPGIDFAGVVEASDDARYAPGDKVVLTGWRVGEVHWGGYAEKARVKADWLVPLPDGLTTRQAMAVGTSGNGTSQSAFTRAFSAYPPQWTSPTRHPVKTTLSPGA
ncbi:MAG: alcohol dehydrogenase catalytic domain-containing protein, partial [Pseudomonadota bacterium]